MQRNGRFLGKQWHLKIHVSIAFRSAELVIVDQMCDGKYILLSRQSHPGTISLSKSKHSHIGSARVLEPVIVVEEVIDIKLERVLIPILRISYHIWSIELNQG